MNEANEIIDSIKDAVKERVGSIMYGMFFISWIGWNWQLIYITFFVDQNILFQNTGLIKIDYINSVYYNIWWWTVLKTIIFPAASAYIIIWWLSGIDLLCSKKHYKNKAKKEIEKSKIEKELLKEEQSVLEEKKKTVKKEKEVQKELSQEDKWKLDIQKIKDYEVYKKYMEELEICLYEYRGQTTAYNYRLAPETLAFLDTNNLINFTNSNRNNLELTDKGKFFLKQYIQNKKDSYI